MCFIILSEARVMITFFHVANTYIGVPIEVFFSFVAVDGIASEPFVKSECAHNIVIGHRVETIEGVLHFLFGANAGLEIGGGTCGRVALPVHDLFFLEAPWFVDKGIILFGLDELIF